LFEPTDLIVLLRLIDFQSQRQTDEPDLSLAALLMVVAIMAMLFDDLLTYLSGVINRQKSPRPFLVFSDKRTLCNLSDRIW
jgi:hypothetical protein